MHAARKVVATKPTCEQATLLSIFKKVSALFSYEKSLIISLIQITLSFVTFFIMPFNSEIEIKQRLYISLGTKPTF